MAPAGTPDPWFSARITGSSPNYGDGFPGMHQDRVAHPGGHQGDADFLLARARVHHGQLVRQQAQHPDLDRGIRAGDTDLIVAVPPARLRGNFEPLPSLVAPSSLLRPGGGAPLWLARVLSPGGAAPLQLAHVTTPGPSTPGCSKNTCTSSHSTW